MHTHSLLAISPLDGRYAKKLTDLAAIVSEHGLIKYRFITEIQWLISLINEEKCELPVTDKAATITALNQLQQNFNETFAKQVKAREAVTAHDIKALEYTMGEAFQADPHLKPLIPWIHFGCTSADINNTAYSLMLKDALHHCLIPQLEKALTALQALAQQSSAMPMMSHTHGQPASPTTMGKEITNFVYRLNRAKDRLYKAPIIAKFNGAVGNYNAHTFVYPEIDWPNHSKNFIESLGLSWQSHSTQVIPADYLAHSLHILSQVMTIIIDLSRDIWLYISMNYFNQKLLKDEVGSSTMPHKINPIHFENAEGNAELARVLCAFLADKMPISRLQRDLSGSTVMRNLGSALGYAQLSILSLANGLSRLEPNAQIMQQQVAQAYDLLAEPVQMMMRRYGVEDAYDQLKQLTRGQGGLTQERFQTFVDGLAIPDEAKQRLRALTPDTYLGLAEELTK